MSDPRTEQIDAWESIIRRIVKDYQRIEKACDAATRAGTLDVNGPLYGAIWQLFASYLKQVDVDAWIDWYIYENDCGKNGMLVKEYQAKATKPIKTPRQLAKLIVDSIE